MPPLPCGVAVDHGFCDDGVCSTTSSDDRYERAVNSDDIIRGKRCVSVGDSAAYEAMVRPRRRTSSPNFLRGWRMLLTRGARGPHSGRALGRNSALSKNKKPIHYRGCELRRGVISSLRLHRWTVENAEEKVPPRALRCVAFRTVDGVRR